MHQGQAHIGEAVVYIDPFVEEHDADGHQQVEQEPGGDAPVAPDPVGQRCHGAGRRWSSTLGQPRAVQPPRLSGPSTAACRSSPPHGPAGDRRAPGGPGQPHRAVSGSSFWPRPERPRDPRSHFRRAGAVGAERCPRLPFGVQGGKRLTSVAGHPTSRQRLSSW